MYYQIENTNVRLAGSMHLVPSGSVLPPWIWEAYGWSEDLCMEANGEDLGRYAYMPAGTLTEQRLPSALCSSVRDAWPAGGTLDSQKLWVVTIVLVTSGLALIPGVEPQITQRAVADSRSIKYLETMGEFAALLDGIEDSVYVEAISRLLADPAKRARGIADMYAAWMTGRVEAIGTVLERTALGQFPRVREIIFDRRNSNWLPRIVAALSTPKRTLILVGAGHLAGTNGLLELLRHEGHRISPVVQ